MIFTNRSISADRRVLVAFDSVNALIVESVGKLVTWKTGGSMTKSITWVSGSRACLSDKPRSTITFTQCCMAARQIWLVFHSKNLRLIFDSFEIFLNYFSNH